MTESLTAILTSTGDFVTSAIGWMGDFATILTTNAVIFVFAVAVPLVGLGIGLLRRMMNTN